MTDATSPEDAEQRMELARQIFRDHPDKISAQSQEAILAQRVILGMSPYEAYLAAGQFAFRVIADQTKWPKNSDPYQVMWGQSMYPDGSQIWMTFQTEMQYPGGERTMFRVFFENGKAVEIERLQDKGGGLQ